MDDTDEDIAKKVQAGDLERFGVLVGRYEKKMLRYARRFVSVREDIEDLVQEVFLKTYANIQDFDATRQFSSWIYRIAHNEFVNALKKKSRQPFFSFDFDEFFPHPTASETATRDTEQRELSEEMEGRLSKISSKYREPIVLYFFEELSYEEIADILHIPISTVGVRIKRGKDQLRELCKKTYEYYN